MAEEGMQVDSTAMAGFSHEVAPITGSSGSMADKIKQRNLLLETYASKELQ